MAATVDTERCGRCGARAITSGSEFPHTFWWFWAERDGGSRERPLHLCRPCGDAFASKAERAEYLRLTLFV